MFNENDSMTGDQNEQFHYQKHVVVGDEWGQKMSLAEYRTQAIHLLNNLDSEIILEFIQLEDRAVVKYNVQTGELAIARRDNGKIKTFYRPNDTFYLSRKLEKGEWADPLMNNDMACDILAVDFCDDPKKTYIYEKINLLNFSVSSLSQKLYLEFCDKGDIDIIGLYNLISDLGESRFLIHDIKQRVMSEDQEKAIHDIRKNLIGPAVILEVLEKINPSIVYDAVNEVLEKEASFQEKYWPTAAENIVTADDLEYALSARDKISYIHSEIGIIQMNYRLTSVKLDRFRQRLKRSDLHLRRVIGRLSRLVNYQNPVLVAPEDFFWRQMK